MRAKCEKCQQSLVPDGVNLRCAGCGIRYHVIPACPDCHHPLEQLRSCGATDYFCHYGHGLVSRRRLMYTVIPLES